MLVKPEPIHDATTLLQSYETTITANDFKLLQNKPIAELHLNSERFMTQI